MRKFLFFRLKLCLILDWKSNLNSIMTAYGVNERRLAFKR